MALLDALEIPLKRIQSNRSTQSPHLILLCFLAALGLAQAQSDTWDGKWPPDTRVASDTDTFVPISATVAQSPPSIQLNFLRPGAYQIFRKDAYATTWGDALTTLQKGSTTWTDTNVEVGKFYEYKALMTDGPKLPQYPNPTGPNPSPNYTDFYNFSTPSGYILTGILVDETQPRGRVILVVTTDVQAKLPVELAQFQADLAADGWFVHLLAVDPIKDYLCNGTGPLVNGLPTGPFPDAHIKLREQIKEIYNAHPGEVKNVILLGKVPLCRTGAGDIRDPDGHYVNQSCWGADGYYANMTGTWTDTKSNADHLGHDGIAVETGGLNLPGDNKFDQYYMSETGGQADMGFGRIDLSNGICAQYEALRVYLNKLHRYKTASPDFQVGRRLAFRPGFYNHATFWNSALNITSNPSDIDIPKIDGTKLLGDDPLVKYPSLDLDAAYSAKHGPYLFYYQGSAGPKISVGGKSVFCSGAQSHWGFWYGVHLTSSENLMPLRLGEDNYELSWTWSVVGLRYFYHRMGMGLDAGDMIRVSINNVDPINGTYAWVTTPGNGGWWGGKDPQGVMDNTITSSSGALFMEHMGDPTLRFFMFAPPENLSVVPTGGHPVLTWTASPDPTVIGYHVYRTALTSGAATGPATRVTSAPITATTYTDADPAAASGQWSYMVRAVRLETTGGGTFYNASLGAAQTIDMSNPPAPIQIPDTTLSDAFWNTAYQETLTAQGGTPCYTWKVASGTFPPGLALATNGTISGSPTTAGSYPFRVEATDALGKSAQKDLTLTVQPTSLITLHPQNSGIVYPTQPNRTQGPLEAIDGQNSFLGFDLAGLNLKNTLASAILRLYIAPGSMANSKAILQAALSAEAPGAAWNCDTLSFNNKPADNPSVPAAKATTTPVPENYVDIDVTPLVQAALDNYTSSKICFRLFNTSTDAIVIASGYSYGRAIPQLIIQAKKP